LLDVEPKVSTIASRGSRLETDVTAQAHPQGARGPPVREEMEERAQKFAAQRTPGKTPREFHYALSDEPHAHFVQGQLVTGDVTRQEGVHLPLGQGHDAPAPIASGSRTAGRDLIKLLLRPASIGRAPDLVLARGPLENPRYEPEDPADQHSQKDNCQASAATPCSHRAKLALVVISTEK